LHAAAIATAAAKLVHCVTYLCDNAEALGLLVQLVACVCNIALKRCISALHMPRYCGYQNTSRFELTTVAFEMYDNYYVVYKHLTIVDAPDPA
jgi:hypothetical protein